jgi:hypothetical protein
MVHDAEEARAAGAEGGWPAVWPLLLFALFAAIVLILYRSCLGGEFLSDDYGYIVTNPYTAELSRENVLAIVHPAGRAKFYTANYAPVHLLLTGLEQQIFADDVVGYHLVNLLIHAANAVLLVALLVASGLPRTGALLGGLLFVVHPANVEAVAWISQLKTNGSLALSLAALLALRRHPAIGTLLFALALLTKAAAASALPVAAAFVWAWRGTPGGSPKRWAWVGAWAVVLGLFAIPQFDAFAHIGGVDVPAYDDRLVQLRTIAGSRRWPGRGSIRGGSRRCRPGLCWAGARSSACAVAARRARTGCSQRPPSESSRSCSRFSTRSRIATCTSCCRG